MMSATHLTGSDATLQSHILGGEGYRPFVYPDIYGNPTVGIGINLNTAETKWFNNSGATLTEAQEAWASEKEAFLKIKGNTTADLRNNSAKWIAFEKTHKFDSDELIFGDAATNRVASAGAKKVAENALNDFITQVRGASEWKGQFDYLAKGTQIGLVDMAYNMGAGNLHKYGVSEELYSDLLANNVPAAKQDMADINADLGTRRMNSTRLAKDQSLVVAADVTKLANTTWRGTIVNVNLPGVTIAFKITFTSELNGKIAGTYWVGTAVPGFIPPPHPIVGKRELTKISFGPSTAPTQWTGTVIGNKIIVKNGVGATVTVFM